MTSFLGRQDEMKELQAFLDNPNDNIFGLYGVPMIGKSLLVNEFLDRNKIAESYNITEVKFQNPENPQITLLNAILGGNKVEELSFVEPSLIYIQNFEECLVWSGDLSHLHDVGDKFPLIRKFLQKVNELPNVKLIIESRFQINYPALNIKIQTLEDIELKGVDTAYFKEKYLEADVSEEEFEVICQNFGNHTWLLAKAYEEREWLFKNVLQRAAKRPKAVTTFLWELLEKVFTRLYKSETLIMCALTLRNPIYYEDLEEELEDLSAFRQYSVSQSIGSLERKFLIQDEFLGYEINPYLREICFTFMKKRRKQEIALLREIPFFDVVMPNYNKIKQLLDRGNFGAFYKELRFLQKNRNYDEVHNILNYALSLDFVNHIIIFNEIAITYRKQKKYDKAFEVLDKALEINPNDVKTLNELAITYKQQQKYDKAIKTLEKALKNEPDNARILNELAIVYKNQKKYDEAIETLEKAFEIEPDRVESLNELAIIYKYQKKYDKAIETLEKAMKLGNVQSYNELAIIYKQQKKYDKAIETLEKAFEIEPNRIESLNELAIIYRQQKKYDKAIEVINQVFQIEPDRIESLNVSATIYKEQGEYEKALKNIDKALRILPQNKYSVGIKRGILAAQRSTSKPPQRSKPPQKQKSPKKRLQKFIGDNRIKKFIKEYGKIAEEMGNEELQNSLLIHSSKFTEITEQKDLGVISYSEFSEKKIPIVTGLIALLKYLD